MNSQTAVSTRLTEFFGITHPIIVAPMAMVSGGRLAAAVTQAGGLGLIGGGYADPGWLRTEIGHAQGARVGCGFITWALAERPEALDIALANEPATVMLSFGELAPYADRIHSAAVPLTAQVQTLEQTRHALEAGATIVVAQGAEAGGHGMNARSTFTLVPEVVDLVARHSPQTLVVAAGGVADGRGLAAALALGADGVLVGTRFWATTEALVSPTAQEYAVRFTGDDTVRTRIYDAVRGPDWPPEYSERVLRNPFLDSWHGREAQLPASLAKISKSYQTAVTAEDYATAAIFVGESIGLVPDIASAADVVADLAHNAAMIIRRGQATA